MTGNMPIRFGHAVRGPTHRPAALSTFMVTTTAPHDNQEQGGLGSDFENLYASNFKGVRRTGGCTEGV
jgi:hypothetical protein